MKMTFNGNELTVTETEDLRVAWNGFDKEQQYELWIFSEKGPMMAMLRSSRNAWLMYLGFSGDDGVVSLGDCKRHGYGSYHLANGQIDERPLSWCISLEDCYQAFAYFLKNDGARYDSVKWQKA